jgi:hypothetical protein
MNDLKLEDIASKVDSQVVARLIIRCLYGAQVTRIGGII